MIYVANPFRFVFALVGSMAAVYVGSAAAATFLSIDGRDVANLDLDLKDADTHSLVQLHLP